MSEDVKDAVYHLSNAVTLLNSMGSKTAARGVVYAASVIERLAADNARLAAEVEGWKRAEEASKRADRVTDVLIRKQREKIASLNAQVERLTPRKMNAEEVCEVLNRHESRPGCWHESDGAISLLQFLRPGMLERVGQIGLREARYIAQGLLRDAGPSAEQEPATSEGAAG